MSAMIGFIVVISLAVHFEKHLLKLFAVYAGLYFLIIMLPVYPPLTSNMLAMSLTAGGALVTAVALVFRGIRWLEKTLSRKDEKKDS